MHDYKVLQDPNLWYGIGLLYDRYGSLEHADEALDAVLKMDPNFPKAREVRFRLGVIAKQQGKYEKALSRLEEVQKELPDTAARVDVLSQIGHVLCFFFNLCVHFYSILLFVQVYELQNKVLFLPN